MKVDLRKTVYVKTLTFILLCSLTIFAQRATSLRGQVTDQFGAVVVGATVTVTDSNGKQRTIQTDSNGAYRFDNLTAGAYNLSAQQKGFATQTVSGLSVSSGVGTHNFQLTVAIEEQRVTVDDMRTLSTDPNSNKTARVISGKDLNMLSDDPNELALPNGNCVAATSVDPSALAVWQTLPHPLLNGVGWEAPGAIFMIPTELAPPRIVDP